MTGCVSSSFVETPGDIPVDTQLSLSPSGKRLLVSWYDKSSKLHAKLVELHGAEVAASREIALPPYTFTTAFSRTDEQILVTTLNKDSNALLKINLEKGESSVIYKSALMLRFPLEVSDDNYVFLEAEDATTGYNRWQRYQHGQKTLLNKKIYNAAAPLNVVDGALFLLEPWTPPAFRNIYGVLPKGISALVDGSTFNIECADRTPLTCLRDHIHFDPTYGTMDLFNGQHRCDIAGRWIDSRELRISRDGSTIVFHAAIDKIDGARAIYIIKNVNLGCAVVPISIRGK